MCLLKKRLIICGNGFDSHHHLKTTYWNYKEFLEEHYPEIFKNYEAFPGLVDYGKGYWHNIEESLEIDYATYFQDTVSMNYPDILNDESDSRWYNIEINLENETEFIKMFTGQCFFEFLSIVSLNVPQSPTIKRFINRKSDFLTFNYTETLEKVYGISDKRILHLHGKLNNIKMIINPPLSPDISNCSTMEEIETTAIPDTPLINNSFVREEIQFGAVGINAEQVKRELYQIYSEDDFFGVSIEPAIDKMADFINMSTKKLQKNIPTLKEFIANKKYDEVIIMGHSILCADELYYKEVLVPAFINAKWIFMNYAGDTSCKINIEKFLKKYQLKNTEIIDW